MYSLTHKFTCFKLQHGDRSSKSARDIWGITELTSSRETTRGAGVGVALSGVRSAGRHHCSFVEPFSHPTSRHRQVPNVRSL